MKKIHVLGNKKGCYSRHLYPIRVFDRELHDNGFDVEYFFHPADKGIHECDVLIFMEASFGEFLPITNTDQNSVAEYLAKYLQGFNKVIWFDDHDSSGMLRTYIFPFIDNYTKSQLLINKKYYQEHHYFGVLHRDYVYGQIHTTENPTFKGVISDEFIQKLKVGWNTAFINWQYFNHHSPYIKELFLKNCRSNKITLTAPNLSKRNLHISYRASLWANYPSIGWWRTNTKNLIENYIKKNQQYYMNS
jgi:hypothetical protein